ncbi:MAG: hypothetical protein KBT27_06250, partial [Prevotellaceae bacterium]|nr:hypothetical protein [Candidatus Faecinaster equi]
MRNTIVFLVAVMCTAWSWGIPSATYQITNVSGGSISVVVSGSQYTLTATPATGYVFYQWEDGSTNPERQMSDVTTSQTLSA